MQYEYICIVSQHVCTAGIRNYFLQLVTLSIHSFILYELQTAANFKYLVMKVTKKKIVTNERETLKMRMTTQSLRKICSKNFTLQDIIRKNNKNIMMRITPETDNTSLKQKL